VAKGLKWIPPAPHPNLVENKKNQGLIDLDQIFDRDHDRDQILIEYAHQTKHLPVMTAVSDRFRYKCRG
jgi:hypothetical protein